MNFYKGLNARACQTNVSPLFLSGRVHVIGSPFFYTLSKAENAHHFNREIGRVKREKKKRDRTQFYDMSNVYVVLINRKITIKIHKIFGSHSENGKENVMICSKLIRMFELLSDSKILYRYTSRNTMTQNVQFVEFMDATSCQYSLSLLQLISKRFCQTFDLFSVVCVCFFSVWFLSFFACHTIHCPFARFENVNAYFIFYLLDILTISLEKIIHMRFIS